MPLNAEVAAAQDVSAAAGGEGMEEEEEESEWETDDSDEEAVKLDELLDNLDVGMTAEEEEGFNAAGDAAVLTAEQTQHQQQFQYQEDTPFNAANFDPGDLSLDSTSTQTAKGKKAGKSRQSRR